MFARADDPAMWATAVGLLSCFLEQLFDQLTGLHLVELPHANPEELLGDSSAACLSSWLSLRMRRMKPLWPSVQFQ